jgi:hypothetical protein
LRGQDTGVVPAEVSDPDHGDAQGAVGGTHAGVSAPAVAA